MENYSDSDTSSESEFDSIRGSVAESDDDESQDQDQDQDQDLEPEPSEYCDKYRNVPWNPDAQIATQLDAAQLAQLHADIKAQAELPDPTYKKLPQSWPIQPFDVQILPDHIQHPIHYFELFWGPEVWNTLVQNTNAYTQHKEARQKENRKERR
jgi:hypothetical protein